MQRRTFILVAVTAGFLFLWARNAHAAGDVVITEIAASPADTHEWIEIYNRGSASISLEGWNFWEDSVNHGLSAFRGALTLGAGELAAVAKDGATFAGDYPEYGGTILDSSWGSLKETGEEIGLKNASGAFVELFMYTPASQLFLQRKDPELDEYTALNWIEDAATPGKLWSSAPTPEEPPAPPPESPPSPEVPSPPAQPPAESPTPVPDVGAPPSVSSTPPFMSPPADIVTTTLPVAPGTPPVQTFPTPPQSLSTPLLRSPRFSYFWGDVWINELMPDPLSGAPEWVELKSNHINNIDFGEWKIKDGGGSLTFLNGTLLAYGFVAIDNPKGNINNSGDRLTLLDHENNVIDETVFGSWSDARYRERPSAPAKGAALARPSGGRATGNPFLDFVETATPTKGGENVITVPVVGRNGTDALRAGITRAAASSTGLVSAASSSVAVSSSPLQQSATSSLKARTKRVAGSRVPRAQTSSRQPTAASDEYTIGAGEVVINGVRVVVSLYAPASTSTFPVLMSAAVVETDAEALSAPAAAPMSVRDAARLPAGARVLTKGVVSVGPGTFSPKYFYLQDDTAGIQVYLHKENFPDIAGGEVVVVEGTITGKRGATLFVDDDTGEMKVTMRERTEINTASFAVGEKVMVRGIVVPGGVGLQMLPRDISDIEAVRDTKNVQPFSASSTTAAPLVDKTNREAYESRRRRAVYFFMMTLGGAGAFLVGWVVRRMFVQRE